MGKHRLEVTRKSVAVLEHLYEHDSRTAKEIADALDMPLSTAYAYLSTLDELDLIDKSREQYTLGLNLLRFGIKSRNTNELYRYVRPYLPQIAQESGDYASFGVGRMGYRILIDIVEGEQAKYDNAEVGEWRPLHLTSQGKAIMSQYEWDELAELVDAYDFEPHKDNTIGSKAEIREEWELTRSRGYAIENEEYLEHIRAIAVPLNPPTVDEVGAISMSGPKHRFTENRIARYVDLLEKYVELIEVDINAS